MILLLPTSSGIQDDSDLLLEAVLHLAKQRVVVVLQRAIQADKAARMHDARTGGAQRPVVYDGVVYDMSVKCDK
jgi:hypothetical protein